MRKAVQDIMVWWLDRGVDGFRMDVINFISKIDGLPDAPALGGFADGLRVPRAIGDFLILHAVTFFDAAPRALVVHVGTRRVPERVIGLSHYAAWLVASALVFWLVLVR